VRLGSEVDGREVVAFLLLHNLACFYWLDRLCMRQPVSGQVYLRLLLEQLLVQGIKCVQSLLHVLDQLVGDLKGLLHLPLLFLRLLCCLLDLIQLLMLLFSGFEAVVPVHFNIDGLFLLVALQNRPAAYFRRLFVGYSRLFRRLHEHLVTVNGPLR